MYYEHGLPYYEHGLPYYEHGLLYYEHGLRASMCRRRREHCRSIDYEHGFSHTTPVLDVVNALLLHSDPWHGGDFRHGALHGAGLHAGTGEAR